MFQNLIQIIEYLEKIAMPKNGFLLYCIILIGRKMLFFVYMYFMWIKFEETTVIISFSLLQIIYMYDMHLRLSSADNFH